MCESTCCCGIVLLQHRNNVILYVNDTYLENTLYHLENTLYQHEISNRFTWNNWKERALQAIRLHVYARIATQQHNFVVLFWITLV